jgi:hypothetical protein
MPGVEFDPRWFDHHSLRLAWLHDDGWAIYPSGATHWPPDDLTPVAAGWPRWGYAGRVQYRPFNENPNWPGYLGGGRIYYLPAVNFVINSATLRRSLVGKSQTASEFPPQGFDAVWTVDDAKTTSAKVWWKVVAVIRPEGLGNAVIPWWDGKSYPQWPPLPRGRPPVD